MIEMEISQTKGDSSGKNGGNSPTMRILPIKTFGLEYPVILGETKGNMRKTNNNNWD